MLRNLKMALAVHPEYGYQVAAKFNRQSSWLSLVIRGERKLSPADKIKMAKILGRPVDTLFPKEMEAA